MQYKFSLKGGSLSSTDVVMNENDFLVRKSISAISEREFGFARWYGQYKKMQRLSNNFPDLVPSPLNFVVKDETYSFTVPYYNNHFNAYDYLTDSGSDPKKFAEQLFSALSNLWSETKPVPASWLKIYWNEEVILRIKYMFHSFSELIEEKVFLLDGDEVQIPTIDAVWNIFEKNLPKRISLVETHGNLTLENILFDPKRNDIKLIDLYDENYFDIAINDLSQLQQSCKYFYEARTSGKYVDDGLVIQCTFTASENLKQFATLLEEFVSSEVSNHEIKLMKLYAASQFFRMAPFKMARSRTEAKYFFLLACKILGEVDD
ncbi:hypothetical protein OA340_00505 [Paracoccaceae bacterium]|nr:hypothetical protein [Paracoccaceae bacterium]